MIFKIGIVIAFAAWMAAIQVDKQTDAPFSVYATCIVFVAIGLIMSAGSFLVFAWKNFL